MTLEIKQRAWPHKTREKYWKWWVELDGPESELDNVKKVVYFLDPTFKESKRVIRSRSTKFRLRSSGWGEFMIRINVHKKYGKKLKMIHWLRLHDEFFGSDRPLNVQIDSGDLEGPESHSVYLTYSASDTQIANTIRDALEANGVKVATANTVSVDMPIETAIENEIEKSLFTIALVPSSDSHWLNAEVAVSLAMKVPVIPVQLPGRLPSEKSVLHDLKHIQMKGASDIGYLMNDLMSRVNMKI